MCSAVYVCASVYVSASVYTCTYRWCICASTVYHCMCLFKCVYHFLHLLAITQTLQSCVVMLCLSARRQNIHSLVDCVCVSGHVCLIHVCVHCVCYVVPYVWSILVIPNQLVRLPDCHPSSSLMSWGLLEPLALATSHTLVYISSCLHARSSHVAMDIPMVLIVFTELFFTKRLLGANPSCHCCQWIATNLSHFMTHAHISHQLHTRQTAPYTHSLRPAQWITSN